jgi:hypothetical protein
MTELVIQLPAPTPYQLDLLRRVIDPDGIYLRTKGS